MKRRQVLRSLVVIAVILSAACGPAVERSSPGPLKILLTNDDGVDFPGLAALAEALAPLGTVTVAAPGENRSGASHGVTSDRPIAVTESVRQGQTWYAIDALPATCLRLAVETLLPERPDLVVSGINVGENLGTVTFYSATVAAAREAAFQGIPSIAVHLARAKGGGMDYRAAAGVLAGIVRALGRDGIPKGTFLNINIPPLPLNGIKGVRITRQDARAPLEFFERMPSGEGPALFKPSWKHLEPAGEGTDIWAIRNGYVSVSVFGYDQSAAVSPGAALSLERLEKLTWRVDNALSR